MIMMEKIVKLQCYFIQLHVYTYFAKLDMWNW